VVGTVKTNSFARSDAAMSQAVDSRFEEYKEQRKAGNPTPSVASVCYPAKSTCVEITSTSDTASAILVSLQASWGGGARELSLRRAIVSGSSANEPHILGFSASGAEVWGPPSGVRPRNEVTTLAGSGTLGSNTGTGAAASFNSLSGSVVDTAGNVFVTDTGNNRLMKVTPAGVVTVFAGATTAGTAEGAGAVARFSAPRGLTIAPNGDMFVADTGNNRIRKVTPAGVVSLVAGGGSGSFNGIALLTSFNAPEDVIYNPATGTLFVADTGNHTIRQLTLAGESSAFSGSSQGFADGSSATAMFSSPRGITVSGSDLLVADFGNNRIRSLTTSGAASTFAGTGVAGDTSGAKATTQFRGPTDLVVNINGDIYITESAGNRVRLITTAGVSSVFIGTGTPGSVDGTGTAASVSGPMGLSVDGSGALYVGDTGGHRLRKIN
jgi:sugar lactone lactonase YvrE